MSSKTLTKAASEAKPFDELINTWVPAVEDALGHNKETVSILTILIKKFVKQRIDYETLSNCVEELLPLDRIGEMICLLNNICNPLGHKEFQLPMAESDPLYTEVSTASEISNIKRKRTFNAIESSSKKRSRAAKQEIPVQSIKNIAGSLRMEMSPPLDLGKEEGFFKFPRIMYPFTEKEDNIPGSPESLNKGLARRSTSGNATTDDFKNINLIVESLAKHSSSMDLHTRNSKPIAEFKCILERASSDGYDSVTSLTSDVGKMFQKLVQKGKTIDCIQNHFFNLVDHYFPSAMGKRN